jgi:hypothetical protein
MEEIWKDITGYEGMYQVSSMGRVKSIDRIVFRSRNGNTKVNDLIMKQGNGHSGYKLITLHKNGKPKTFRINRIVAIHFIDNPENKTDVNHKDGIKSNNSVSNLEWNTGKENISHAHKTGLRNGNHRKKLTKDQVLYIKANYVRLKVTVPYFAKLFGVSESCIRHIVSGVNWNYLVNENV